MRKNTFQEKIQLMRRNEKKRIIRNAKRGAAQPYSMEKAQKLFRNVQCHREKLRLFNLHISHLFPLILDLIADGWTIVRVERQMCLTHRMLWRWLMVRGELMDMVRRARQVRRASWDKVGVVEAP